MNSNVLTAQIKKPGSDSESDLLMVPYKWVLELAPPILLYLQVRKSPSLPCSNSKNIT